jgi:hypothetical protein
LFFSPFSLYFSPIWTILNLFELKRTNFSSLFLKNQGSEHIIIILTAYEVRRPLLSTLPTTSCCTSIGNIMESSSLLFLYLPAVRQQYQHAIHQLEGYFDNTYHFSHNSVRYRHHATNSSHKKNNLYDRMSHNWCRLHNMIIYYELKYNFNHDVYISS